MTKGIYFKRRGISFFTAMTIYFTLFLFPEFFQGSNVSDHLNYNTVIFVGVYMVIGLASRDYRPIGILVERVWSLNCTDGVDDNAKLQTIRAYIAINVAQWDKYWRLYQEIIDNKEGLWTWKHQIKNQLLRISKGSLNLVQFSWIVGYITYNVLKNNGYLPFLPAAFTSDFDFLIDVLGLGFFSYTSGKVIGMGNFMSKMFESIKPSKEKDVKETLRLLEQHIIFGARHYGFLRNMIDIQCELPSQIINENQEVEIKG